MIGRTWRVHCECAARMIDTQIMYSRSFLLLRSSLSLIDPAHCSVQSKYLSAVVMLDERRHTAIISWILEVHRGYTWVQQQQQQHSTPCHTYGDDVHYTIQCLSQTCTRSDDALCRVAIGLKMARQWTRSLWQEWKNTQNPTDCYCH